VGDDGRILVRCFGGCRASEIVGSLGLALGDLFPESLPSPDAMREAKIKREAANRIDAAKISMLTLRRKAEKVIKAARGIDISGWPESEVDEATRAVGAAYEILLKEQLDITLKRAKLRMGVTSNPSCSTHDDRNKNYKSDKEDMKDYFCILTDSCLRIETLHLDPAGE
jgi:hypothetical protein